MSKVYVRKWAASEPVEVDVEKLRKCEPPYEGNSHEELLQYLNDEVWNNYDWSDTNEEVYGEDAAYALMREGFIRRVFRYQRKVMPLNG